MCYLSYLALYVNNMSHISPWGVHSRHLQRPFETIVEKKARAQWSA